MIRFEFTLEDSEAEELIGLIQKEIAYCHDQIQQCILEGSGSTRIKTGASSVVYMSRISYLDNLRHKIASSSTRIESS